MTLVASILGKGLPVLLGDLLISREGEVADSVISVPSVGEISASAFGYTAVQLRQKLCIINDGLAVGWAGSRTAATTVIRDLLSAAKGQEFSKTDLENFFKNLDRRDLRDLKNSRIDSC